MAVVTGTGTEIGKTHFTQALLRAWARALSATGLHDPYVLGIKPVESGVASSSKSDAEMLQEASTFHVKHRPPPYRLTRAVSPHLAAREQGTRIDAACIVQYVRECQNQVHGLAVELAGGLFSPLGPALSNADIAGLLRPTALFLVAPDRLGVLHEVGATTRAALAAGLTIDGILLVAPETADASTGSNAAELHYVTEVPVMATVQRATVQACSLLEGVARIATRLVNLPR